MPKKTSTRKPSALEPKQLKFAVNIKLPLRLRPGNIHWKNLKKLLPRSSNQVLVALLIVASFLLGMLYTKVQYLEKGQSSNQQAAVPSVQPTALQKVQRVKLTNGDFPVLGNKDAKVTLIEFADFRCPYCEQFFTNTEPQIIQNYADTGKIKFAFRNFAFLSGNAPDGQQASLVAANAVACANDQGKFWDYYNYLYKNQPQESDTSMYNTDTLTQEAVTLGLNGDNFRSCLTNKTDQSKVEKDLTDGKQAGVSGTPSFFINGQIIVGACPFATIKGAIDAESAHKQWSVDDQCQLAVK